VIDYRPALRERSGVGEYVHQLVRALARQTHRPSGHEVPVPHGQPPERTADEISIFTSSWKDRPLEASLAELPGVRVIDRRIPVALLTFAWQRLGWPPIERLAGVPVDVVQSPHPLLLPARHAAQLVTIHDLDFLVHPERVRAEIRRDYPALARDHAHRADGILVPSNYTAREVVRMLGVPVERITVCHHGAPEWAPGPLEPRPNGVGYILFVGTLEARKNVGALLHAYAILAARNRSIPRLVLAGKTTPDASGWLEMAAKFPLAGRVELVGYVQPSERRELYRRAKLLVLPSYDEGFGLPALEAMAMGIPVVASNRGALPEVLGEAGMLVDPDDHEALVNAIERVLQDELYARGASERGLARAREFTWDRAAETTRKAYQEAIRHRRQTSRSRATSHE